MERPHTYSGFLWLPIIFALVLWADWSGNLNSLQHVLDEKRTQFYERHATQDIVYMSIDKASLDRVGLWPWPRSKTAEIVDRLLEAEAADIVLDFDFSTPSNPLEDEVLRQALERAGNTVILPVKSESDRPNGSALPLAELMERSRLAISDVPVEADGLTHALPFEHMVDGRYIPSVASLLSGEITRTGSELIIDYSISPASIPSYSALNLIDGNIGRNELRGKSIIVGTPAVEAGSAHIVPIHGMLPSPIVQILAAETLRQDRSLHLVPSTPFLASFALLLLALAWSRRFSELSHQLIICFILAAGLSVAAFVMQKRFAVLLPTAPVQMLLWLYAVTRSLNELAIRRWKVLQTSIEASNMRHMLTRIISDSSDAILIVDESGLVLETSRQAPEILGFEARPGVTQRLSKLVPAELVIGAKDSMRLMQAEQWKGSEPRLLELQTGRFIEYTVTPSRLSGRRLGFRKLQNHYVACITARDVTEKHRQDALLEYMSRFDELTGAMRRPEFQRRLDNSLLRQRRDESCNQTVFALNLHRFRTINATLGRSVGDALLKAVVERLNECQLDLSPAARLGSDIFALFSKDTISKEEACVISRQLTEIVEAPYDLDGARAQIGVRIGISPVRLDTPSPAATSLSQAELALDDATRIGASSVVIFDPEAFAKQERAREIEQELWSALDRREIYIAYQPQVLLTNGQLVGAEALIRWNHPRLGAISPGDFIAIAEANGFIEKLGRWTLHRACEDAATWPDHVSVSVNVSPMQLCREGFVDDVKTALEGADLKAERLHLEFTESAFIEASDELAKNLDSLRGLGISFALDDFGTGFSSLGYLSTFPLDIVKLDQMFVRNLTSDSASQAIVQSVKTLADGLGLTVICEGVETEEQRSFVQLIGCHQGQGFLFGRPQSAADIARLSDVRMTAIA